MKQQILGQPAWMWAAGAAVIIGGYLYLKHKQSSSAAQPAPGAGGGGGKSTSTSTFRETITDLHSNPKPRRKRA